MNKTELKNLIDQELGTFKDLRADVDALVQGLQAIQNGGDVTFTAIDASKELIENLTQVRNAAMTVRSAMKARAIQRMKEG